MTTQTDTVLTLEDAAAFLKVSEDVVQNLLEQQDLAGRKIGGEWRTTTRAIIGYVDGVPMQTTCCTTEDGSTACCTPGQSGCC